MAAIKLTENAPRFGEERRVRRFTIIGFAGVAVLLAVSFPALFSGEFGELEVSSDRPTMSGSPELSWENLEHRVVNAEPEARARFGTFEPVEMPSETDELLADLSKGKNEVGVVHLSDDDGSKRTLELKGDRWQVRP